MDKIVTLFKNLVETRKFIETSKSDIQWHGIMWRVVEETTLRNVEAESGQELGAFEAGCKTNKIVKETITIYCYFKYLEFIYRSGKNFGPKLCQKFKYLMGRIIKRKKN